MKKPNLPTVRVGGIDVLRMTRKELAEWQSAYCLKARKAKSPLPFVVYSANGQVLALQRADAAYKKLLDEANAVDADGQSLVFASRWLSSKPLTERCATTDYFHDIARVAERDGLKFYLLGTTQTNLDVAVKAIKSLYPRLKIVGTRNGYFKQEDEAGICRAIVKAKPDVLWIGLGTPRQEQFVSRTLQRLKGLPWIKTCGGLFDYFHPTIKRAPEWMQRVGLEWLFRTIQEPSKYLRRYATTNLIAIWILARETR